MYIKLACLLFFHNMVVVLVLLLLLVLQQHSLLIHSLKDFLSHKGNLDLCVRGSRDIFTPIGMSYWEDMQAEFAQLQGFSKTHNDNNNGNSDLRREHIRLLGGDACFKAAEPERVGLSSASGGNAGANTKNNTDDKKKDEKRHRKEAKKKEG